MGETLQLAEITIHIARKDIANVHVSVHPPEGEVRVSAPEHFSLASLRAFLITKLAWMRAERAKFQEQPRNAPLLYIDRESHYLWGERYLLEVIERDAPPEVDLGHGVLRLYVRPGTGEEKREEVLSRWYRDQVRDAVNELLPVWEKRLGVQVERSYVQRMKTRWGSCNPAQGTIRLNTELAKNPRRCLEYVLVHELAHLHDATHGPRFRDLMDHHVPTWKTIRDELNGRALAHQDWTR
ncbi:MAG: metal-dependent hydrolase [Sandaracinus sp.]|nr:metal-dependent hydrolase [Sandaracinus sp.]|tara:strand:- start:1616 stop:2332 length:717 start_codon:yes stop_codon:yes gene_type:complete